MIFSPAIHEKPEPAFTDSGYFSYGGDEGDRTPDLLHAMQALSQLSYAPDLL